MIRITTRNLFDSYSMNYDGHFLYRGDVRETPGRWGVSDYIPVASDSVILTQNNINSDVHIACYDKNKAYIRSSPYTERCVILNTTGASFVRLSAKEGDNIQLEEGTVATPYVPHFLEVDRIVQTTRNLFDRNAEYYSGYINSEGTLNESPIWKYTGYIPVNSSAVTLQGNITSSVAYMAAYDENKQLLATAILANTDRYNKTLQHDDMKYVRFSFQLFAMDGIQLEEGTTATPYIPHLLEIKSIQQKTNSSMNTLFEKE